MASYQDAARARLSQTGKDLESEEFYALRVLRRAGSDKHGFSMWLCECKCGKKRKVRGANLRSGATRSCGYHCHYHLSESR